MDLSIVENDDSIFDDEEYFLSTATVEMAATVQADVAVVDVVNCDEMGDEKMQALLAVLS